MSRKTERIRVICTDAIRDEGCDGCLIALADGLTRTSA